MKIPKDKKIILDTLIEKVKRDYPDTIDAVIVYGSYVTDRAHDLSDLDFFFIPNNESAFEMSVQFIYDEIGYDFWPITWDRLERFVCLKEDLLSLIGRGQLVYARDESVRNKYLNLEKRSNQLDAYDLEQAINRHLNLCKAKYFDMYEDHVDLTADILSHLIQAVAYLNKTYIKKSVNDLRREIQGFKLIPKDFYDRVYNIASQSYMVHHNELKQLITDVEKLRNKSHEVQDLKGFYEELKSSYNKIYHACDIEDYLTIFFTLSNVCHEVRYFLGEKYSAYPFPDLSAEVRRKNYKRIKESTKIHEQTLCFVLKEMDVTVERYEDLDDFKKKLGI
ncbi:nucleotidyltransferase domain-containing protein [Acidaminobacter sp. JC074]|uniref:nucleotidyltransferase domain-containing protein n=1 Tax=Acidaminobacter sp. JC074 TaxID=2530199 RepID=UPI001F10B625|nr:nucleotidyltransferase domain-containing protein [Acidaminobacter sp. JC074]